MEPISFYSVHGGSLDGIFRTFAVAQRALKDGDGIVARLDSRQDSIYFFETVKMPHSGRDPTGTAIPPPRTPVTKPAGKHPFFSVHVGPFAGIYCDFQSAQRATMKGDGFYARLDDQWEAVQFFESGRLPDSSRAKVPSYQTRPVPSEMVDLGGGFTLSQAEFHRLFDETGEGSPSTEPAGGPDSLRSAPSELRIEVQVDPVLADTSSRISTAVKEAAELGSWSYMPVAFGEHVMFALPVGVKGAPVPASTGRVTIQNCSHQLLFKLRFMFINDYSIHSM